jgi:hypothetical protein
MKKPLLLTLFFFCCLLASSQQVHFIYLQSDQPFYLKMDDKVYSSNEPDFLILPNLADSNYTFFIGLPSGAAKEAKFSLQVKGVDRGFNIGVENGNLYLRGIEDGNRVEPLKNQSKQNISYLPQIDPFTSLLAKAANDTSLLYIPIIAKVEVPPASATVTEVSDLQTDVANDTLAEKVETAVVTPRVENAVAVKEHIPGIIDSVAVVRVDTLVVKPTTTEVADSVAVVQVDTLETTTEVADTVRVAVVEPEQQVQPDTTFADRPMENYSKSEVTKVSQMNTDEGVGLVFVDKGESTDTIRLVIPNSKFVFKEEKPDTVTSEVVFLEVKKDTEQPSIQRETTVVLAKPCTNEASARDFFKLRKNMASEITDEAMVAVAEKSFSSKCFSTEQIKNLGALFLTSAGKYLFFKAALGHVTDPDLFPSLQAQITDEYYLGRFKLLIDQK